MTKLMIRPRRSGLIGDFESFFDDVFRYQRPLVENNNDFSPRVNIRESKDHVTLTFELPGMDKKDIKVTMDDGMLSVSGKREFKGESEDGGYVRTEISSGSFCRLFTLPDTVDAEKISADYKEGLLEIKMDKLEEVKPKEIEVKVS